MKVYNCKVRCHGDVRDEVVRIAITAAEIKVLRHLHGNDAVVDIKLQQAEADRTEEEERDRLERRYGEPKVAEVFGVRLKKIADDVIEEDLPAEVQVPVEEDKLPVVKRTAKRAAPTDASDAMLT